MNVSNLSFPGDFFLFDMMGSRGNDTCEGKPMLGICE